jgi:HEAT repeat protein
VSLPYLAILGFVLAAAPNASPTSLVGNPGNGRAKLEAYLASHDVATAAELRELGSAPDKLLDKQLMDIAEDGRVEGLVRARAVAALRLYPSTEVRGFLGTLLQAKAKDSDARGRLLLRRAAIALGWLSGPRACDYLVLLFENDDPEVRVDAAIGLGLTRAAEAPSLLHRQLTVESVPRVRDQLERQLRALGKAPPAPEKKPAPKQRTPMRGGF